MRVELKKALFVPLALVAVVALASGLTLGQTQRKIVKNPYSKEGLDKPNAPGAPGSHHQHLKQLVGKWSATARIYTPDAEPMELAGSMTNSMILGNRFLRSEYSGEMFGKKFLGEGIDGYDNTAQQHVATWIDSETTEILQFRGSCEDDGRVVTTYADRHDAKTGKTRKIKSIVTMRSTTMYTFEYWEEGEDGEYSKTMEAIYKRT